MGTVGGLFSGNNRRKGKRHSKKSKKKGGKKGKKKSKKKGGKKGKSKGKGGGGIPESVSVGNWQMGSYHEVTLHCMCSLAIQMPSSWDVHPI